MRPKEWWKGSCFQMQIHDKADTVFQTVFNLTHNKRIQKDVDGDKIKFLNSILI